MIQFIQQRGQLPKEAFEEFWKRVAALQHQITLAAAAGCTQARRLWLTEEQLHKHLWSGLTYDTQQQCQRFQPHSAGLVSLTAALLAVQREREAPVGPFYNKSSSKEDTTNTAVNNYYQGGGPKAMSGSGKPRRFNGKCHSCGRAGHKSADCRSTNRPTHNNRTNNRNGGNKPRFQGNCHYCGKPGHRKNECRQWLSQQPGGAHRQPGGGYQQRPRQNQ
ncbi:MAG: hypothetical protein GY826_29830, partial [Fuerstiella sp.]|nr:hypothetical protein [Fuerstiella sp.]